jgi:choline dehydrogenase-like flavoprotein
MLMTEKLSAKLEKPPIARRSSWAYPNLESARASDSAVGSPSRAFTCLFYLGSLWPAELGHETVAAMTTQLSFHEVLTGGFAWGEKDPQTGEQRGIEQKITFGFDGMITMDDLDKFIADPAHTGAFTGKYLGNLFEWKGLPTPEIVSGVFNFMAPGQGAPRLMVHEHVLRSGSDTFYLSGKKLLEGDPLQDHTVFDLTTLYTTLADSKHDVVAAGVMHFPMTLFLDLVTSFHATGTDSPFVAKMKFLKLFLREETYVLLTGARATPVPPNVRRALARPSAERKKAYDVVVIGSGYGGGVAAARLTEDVPSKAKRSVCVLERGRELRAGEFPVEPWQLAAQIKSPLSPHGLFELVDAGDIETVVGNGLGGTSLINANVMLEADPNVFKEARWPKDLPDLSPFYEAARRMIAPVPHPAPPLKANALRDAVAKNAKDKGEPAPPIDTVPIAVNFVDGRARADTGNTQRACTNCGACVTGCNVTAKSTVDMTYLSVAEKQGAEIYVETEVLGIEPLGAAGFRVHTAVGDPIVAKQVVLAAGVLGSFRVLTKSRETYGLAVSPALGKGFTGNGDILGFGYNTDVASEPGAGPTITTRVSYTSDADVRKHFILEDGGVPQAVSALLRAALPLVRQTAAPGAHGFFQHLGESMREAADFVGLTQYGALRRSAMYFGMGTEKDTGTLRLDAESVKVDWPGVANEEFAARIDTQMEDLTFAQGGLYVKNPDARTFLREKFITAHPLGGCTMGDDPASSVVDVRGALFDYPGGLFVADGSIVPTALGLNPALTIAALAEYVCKGIKDAWA